MACTLTNTINKLLPDSVFAPEIYSPELKQDIFASLHHGEVKGVIGDLKKEEYSFTKLESGNAAIDTGTSVIEIHPVTSFYTHAAVAHFFKKDKKGKKDKEDKKDERSAPDKVTAYYTDNAKHERVQHMLDILKASSLVQTSYKDGVEEDFYIIELEKYRRLTTTGGITEAFTEQKSYDSDTVYENIIKSKWGKANVPRTTALPVGFNRAMVTADEFKQHMEDNVKKAQLKGRIIHFIVESEVAKKAGIPVEDKLVTLYESDLAEYATYYPMEQEKADFGWVADKIDVYLESLEINLDSTDELFGSTVALEVGVISRTMKYASRVDMITQRNFDGKLGIYDLKTGSGVLTADNRRLLNSMSNHFLPIFDNPRDRAKLELMLRAIAIKENEPDAMFHTLRIGNMQNAEKAGLARSVDIVDPEMYMQFIEKIFKNKKLTDEMGLTDSSTKETLYNTLKAKSPRIFEAGDYFDNTPTEMHNEIKGDKADYKLASKLQVLADLNADNFVRDTINGKKKMQKLTEDILKLSEFNTGNWDNSFGDMSMLTSKLGHYSDVKLPIIKVWAQMYYKGLAAYQDEYGEIKSKLENIAIDLNKEHREHHGYRIKATKYAERIDVTNPENTGLYDFAYTTYTEDNQKLERLLQESDPEFDKLLPMQKKFLKEVNKLMELTAAQYNEKKYSIADPYKNFSKKERKAMQNKEKWSMSMIDLQNNATASGGKGERGTAGMEKGFFFKFAMEGREESMSRWNPSRYPTQGDTKRLAGLFKGLRKDLRDKLTYFNEDTYEADNLPKYMIPIRGLGSRSLGVSRMYTKNLLASTLQGLDNAINKKHLDNVAVLGQGVQQWLVANKSNDNEKFTNYQSFFGDKLVRGVIGSTIRGKYMSYAPGFTVTDDFGNKRKVSINFDKVIGALGSFGSAVTMPIRIFEPIGTGVQAYLTLARDIATNHAYKALYGAIPKSYRNYNLASFGKAHKEMLKVGYDEVTGNVRSNKAFLLMRQLGYLPKGYTGYLERNKLAVSNMRIFSSDTFYAIQTMSEDTLTYLTLISQLQYSKHAGIDPETGKTVTKSMYDWYKVIDGKLTWTGGIRGGIPSKIAGGKPTLIKGLTSQEISHMKLVYEELQGSYREEELAPIEAYAWGKALMSLKRWLPRLLINMFKGKREDFLMGNYQVPPATRESHQYLKDADGKEFMVDDNNNKIPILEWKMRVSEGKFWTLGKAIVSLIPFKKTQLLDWKNLEFHEKRTITEGLLAAFVMGMGFLGFAYAPDDFDDTMEAKWLKRYLIDNLSHQYNIFELGKDAINFGSIVGMEKAYDFADNLTDFMLALALLQHTQDGDLVGARKLMLNIPYVAPVFRTYNKLVESYTVEVEKLEPFDLWTDAADGERLDTWLREDLEK